MEGERRDLPGIVRRLLTSLAERALILGARTFEVGGLEIRLAAAIATAHEAEVESALTRLQEQGLLSFRPVGENWSVTLLDSCVLPDRDVEERERMARLRARRVLLFHLYDENGDHPGTRMIPLVDVGNGLGYSDMEGIKDVLALKFGGYLHYRVADGGRGTSQISEYGVALCEDRMDLFAELCALPLPSIVADPEPEQHAAATPTARPDPGYRRFFSDTTELTSWAGLKMRFLDDHGVRVTIGDESQVLGFAQLGFADRRHGRPTRQWDLLVALASSHGVIDWGHTNADLKNQKPRERLSKSLRSFFGLADDPIAYDPGSGGWTIRFEISSRSG